MSWQDIPLSFAGYTNYLQLVVLLELVLALPDLLFFVLFMLSSSANSVDFVF